MDTDLFARMLTDFTDFLFFLIAAIVSSEMGLHRRSASPASHGFVRIPRIALLLKLLNIFCSISSLILIENI